MRMKEVLPTPVERFINFSERQENLIYTQALEPHINERCRMRRSAKAEEKMAMTQNDET